MLKQEKGFKTVADWRAQLLKKQGRRTHAEYKNYMPNICVYYMPKKKRCRDV